jgi:hypothetical protein
MAHRSHLIALVSLTLLAAGCKAEDGAVAVPWLPAEPTSGGRVLKFGYENDPCTRARQARVKEDSGSVTVTLQDPERDPEQTCIALAKPGCVTVRLANSLAGRRVVDGGREGFRPSRRGADRVPFSHFGPCRRVPVVR